MTTRSKRMIAGAVVVGIGALLVSLLRPSRVAVETALVSRGPLRVTLARPERRNAFDAALIAELTEAFSADAVGDARAVVLSGEGPSFCAGLDFASFLAGDGDLYLDGLLGKMAEAMDGWVPSEGSAPSDVRLRWLAYRNDERVNMDRSTGAAASAGLRKRAG